MLPAPAEDAIRQIITAISAGDYDDALARLNSSRCSASDLARVVSDYGKTFAAPPFSEWDVISIGRESGLERWSVRAPFWSEGEGGRSDLELHLTLERVRLTLKRSRSW
jgi:hypothetical protein